MDKMNCYLCKGIMKEGTTSYVIDLDNCVIVVRNVPCLKCEQCGEVAYSDDVAKRLDEIVSGIKGLMTEVAIVEYSTAA